LSHAPHEGHRQCVSWCPVCAMVLVPSEQRCCHRRHRLDGRRYSLVLANARPAETMQAAPATYLPLAVTPCPACGWLTRAELHKTDAHAYCGPLAPERVLASLATGTLTPAPSARRRPRKIRSSRPSTWTTPAPALGSDGENLQHQRPDLRSDQYGRNDAVGCVTPFSSRRPVRTRTLVHTYTMSGTPGGGHG